MFLYSTYRNLMSKMQIITTQVLTFFATLMILVGCAQTVPENSEQAAALKAVASRDPSKLLIVDCLLPGQIRKLGTSAVYSNSRGARSKPRKPIVRFVAVNTSPMIVLI